MTAKEALIKEYAEKAKESKVKIEGIKLAIGKLELENSAKLVVGVITQNDAEQAASHVSNLRADLAVLEKAAETEVAILEAIKSAE